MVNASEMGRGLLFSFNYVVQYHPVEPRWVFSFVCYEKQSGRAG